MTAMQVPKASTMQHHLELPSATAEESRDDRLADPVIKTWTSALRTLAIIAICVGAAAAVYSQRTVIGQGIHNVRDLHWAWVAAASLSEALSMLALVLLYQALLPASQARLTVTWIFASTHIANAISTAVPVIGSGMASRQAYRQFREGGADPAAASLTLTLAGVASTATFATVVIRRTARGIWLPRAGRRLCC